MGRHFRETVKGQLITLAKIKSVSVTFSLRRLSSA